MALESPEGLGASDTPVRRRKRIDWSNVSGEKLKRPRTILDETDELGKSVDKDVSILIENKPLEKPKKEVQAQTACAAVEKDAKDLKAPEPKVEPSKDAGLQV